MLRKRNVKSDWLLSALGEITENLYLTPLPSSCNEWTHFSNCGLNSTLYGDFSMVDKVIRWFSISEKCISRSEQNNTWQITILYYFYISPINYKCASYLFRLTDNFDSGIITGVLTGSLNVRSGVSCRILSLCKPILWLTVLPNRETNFVQLKQSVIPFLSKLLKHLLHLTLHECIPAYLTE